MNDQIDKLRELVVRGSTEGERRAALVQLERRLAFSGTPEDDSKNLATLSDNDALIISRLKSIKSSIAFFGTFGILITTVDWHFAICLAFSSVVWLFVE